MCGRFTHKLQWSEIVALYRLTMPEPPEGWSARYNLAPTQRAPVIRLNPQSGQRELVMLRWGLVPFWAKNDKIGYSTINARAETVATKPAFREAFKRRRCLVLASGFYEWRSEAKVKQPFHFTCADGGPMTFAGLWERWDRGAAPLETFTIIVGGPNAQTAPYHDRMPSILAPDEWDRWLDPATESAALQALLRPYEGKLQIDRVSRNVNSVKNDQPDLILPTNE